MRFTGKIRKKIHHQGIEASIRVPAAVAHNFEDKDKIQVDIEKAN